MDIQSSVAPKNEAMEDQTPRTNISSKTNQQNLSINTRFMKIGQADQKLWHFEEKKSLSVRTYSYCKDRIHCRRDTERFVEFLYFIIMNLNLYQNYRLPCLGLKTNI